MQFNCSLSTSSHEHELPTGGKIASVFVFVCLTVGTIFGNALVIRAVCKFSSLRTAANIILVSLSVADLLMVTVFILRVVMILGQKNSRYKLCELTLVINFTLTAIIILHLALISVERFTAIKFSLRYLSLVTHRRTLIASGTVWLWGLGVSIILPLLLFRDMETCWQIMKALTPCLNNSCQDNAILHSNQYQVSTYLIFLLIALLVLPIATVIASYSYIIKVAYNQQKQIMSDESSSQAGQVNIKREMKAARTVAIVVGLCLASYTPLVIMLCIRVASINSTIAKPKPMFVTYCVASLNALWNPLVYGWRNENFRSSFKRLLKFRE